jgi:hypothetical protein
MGDAGMSQDHDHDLDHDHGHHHGHDHHHDHHNHDHHHDRHHHDHGDQPGSLIGHNHGAAGPYAHLHSHALGGGERAKAQELQLLTTAFIEGFRAAADKPSYLRLAGVPQSRPGPDGLTMHLVDVTITANWQMGTASPAFASRELVYLPYPAKMVSEREDMRFTYVSITSRSDVSVQDILADRA